jgi:hypothetical protein
VAPRSTVEVSIDYNNMYQYSGEVKSLRHNVKVYLRRHLSELRDNYLCRHDGLLALVYRMKNRDLLSEKGEYDRHN